MNNNLSFFDVVVRPILVIIGFLIGLGVLLSAKGDSIPYSLPEKEVLDAYKTVQNVNTNEILPNLSNQISPDTIVQGSSSFKSLEEKISRLESVINKDNNLRKLYHGGSPTVHFETNLETRIIQRLDKYPDGYIHIEKGAERKLLTAEESAKRIIKRKNINNSRIKGLKTRIAMLEKASDAQSKARLEQCKRLLERLERTSTTNYVDVVIKPQ